MVVQAYARSREADFFNVCNSCVEGCCTGVRPPLTERRKRIIEHFLKENGIAMSHPFTNGGYSFPREMTGGRCIFLDTATTRCRIHQVKPETCVAGPFTFSINGETGKIEWFLKKDSVCPLAGQLCRNPEVYKKHMKAAKRELRNLVRDLDAEALREIMKIEELDAVKVGENNAAPSVLAKLKP